MRVNYHGILNLEKSGFINLVFYRGKKFYKFGPGFQKSADQATFPVQRFFNFGIDAINRFFRQ
jgi:hypothetical protein